MSPDVLMAITVIGLSTALLGGIASLWQTNFKRGIAYSTASQLGWMFVAVGLSAPFAAFFHLLTHASFKAMMFLSAGTVIHAAHHEEDIRKMGGLRRALPGAHIFFLLGALAIIGTPFLSGSFSKDAILEAAHESTTMPWVFFALLAGAVITGLYAGRLYGGLFLGAAGEGAHHAESHRGHLMGFDAPLVPLAVGAVVLGYLEAGTHTLSSWLKGIVVFEGEVHVMPTGLGLLAFGLGAVGFAGGIALSRTAQKGLPVPSSDVVTSVLDEALALPGSLARLHTGSIGRYLLVSVVAGALVTLLALRAPSMAPPSASGFRRASPIDPRTRNDRAAGQRAVDQLQNGLQRMDPAFRLKNPLPSRPAAAPAEGATR
jgi:NADH:ubiquinone oxidoreductase subunit 5 (subunit L)/multisubunit Na+/H+ antiporter MnhA subunit